MASPILRAVLLIVAFVSVAWAVLQPEDEPYDRRLGVLLEETDGELVDVRAADFVLTDLQGQTHRLSDFEGETVFLNFWATWCPPCVEEMPSMMALARALDGRPFRIIAVTQDTDDEALVGFLTRFGIDPSTMLVLRDPDGEVARRYGTSLLPETFVIDARGRTVARFAGPRDWSSEPSRRVVERVMRGDWRGR